MFSDDSRFDNGTINLSDYRVGFSIDKKTNDALNPYIENSENRCILDQDINERASDTESILGEEGERGAKRSNLAKIVAYKPLIHVSFAQMSKYGTT